MLTALTSTRRRCTIPGVVALTLLLTGCGDDGETPTAPSRGASSRPAPSASAATDSGAVSAAAVKPVDLTALGYESVIADKAELASFPTVYLPFASTCPGTKDLVPQADGTGASRFKILRPIIAARSLNGPFVVSVLGVKPAELVAAINEAVAGCADVKATVSQNTPRAGVTRIQVNYRTPRFNNGANGGRPVAGLTYIAALMDGSYVSTNLYGDPNIPQTAPRYDLTDPFEAKLLDAAGIG